MFISSSITSSLEFWSVNHTSICENFKLKVFKNIKCFGYIASNWPNDYFEQMYPKLLNFADNQLNIVNNIVNNITMY